jgi:hypothetical protein
MKRTRFTEEQIIAILRENDAGTKAGEQLARNQGVSEGDDLCMERQVRRDGRVGRAAAEGAGG